MTAKPNRILIVEDQPHIARILSDILRKQGYDVMVASNGIMAVEHRRTFQPDMAFMDIMMPLKSGLDALRDIREIPSMTELPVVFLTARADASERKAAETLGAVGFIAKPFSPRTIVSVAGETLGRGQSA